MLDTSVQTPGILHIYSLKTCNPNVRHGVHDGSENANPEIFPLKHAIYLQTSQIFESRG